ncbi:restriction endonuclease subunit S [Algoriphagus aquimarinus]|uniref:Type I restriction enzyme, S subunit n=1 Tax=Algoriphagus aquimarinus TaxID=237018 RepID=A0A1I0Y2G6_9BACT|nr:restriction endonuclease subunit S [Algoriphagus aquimarinus]SFB07334.1 type I restriction enzyme, S subunit [Algoriphagus aquimarinus]
MHNWEVQKVGDISESYLGKMLDKEKNKGTFHPYLSNKCVRWGGFDFNYISEMRFEPHEHKRFGLEYGDLVICEGGEPGRCAIWKNEISNMKIQKALHRVRVKSGYSNEFLYYQFLLAGKTGSIEKHFIGSTIKHLTGVGLKQIEFNFPHFKIQQNIAKVLSDLDSKIELNNKINAELEGMAKLIYEYWFVQFDFPFDFAQGKPSDDSSDPKDVKPYKSSGGKMVWNEELKREIPEGWEVGTLLDIANFYNGIACQKFRPEGEELKFRVIKIREMNDGFSDNTEFVKRDVPEPSIINNGDVLFSWSATLDVKIWTGGIGCLNQHIFKITSNDYPRTFYYFELLKYLEHFKMMANLRKTTMGHITQEHLKQSRISIPKKNLIQSLDKKINPILNKIVKNQEENQKLSSLRDWLLPMLMNGQVRVNNNK